MCLIFQRALSNIPIIVMGESGVGKTALIQYLVEVVLNSKFLAFNIHAGIDE
jgi:midasin (ATPase involved in ribosome maturation)